MQTTGLNQVLTLRLNLILSSFRPGYFLSTISTGQELGFTGHEEAKAAGLLSPRPVVQVGKSAGFFAGRKYGDKATDGNWGVSGKHLL